MQPCDQIVGRQADRTADTLDTGAVCHTRDSARYKGALIFEQVGHLPHLAIDETLVGAAGDAQSNHLGLKGPPGRRDLFTGQVGTDEHRVPTMVAGRNGNTQGAQVAALSGRCGDQHAGGSRGGAAIRVLLADQVGLDDAGCQMLMYDPERSLGPSSTHVIHERHDHPIGDGLVTKDQGRLLQQVVEASAIQLEYGLQTGIDCSGDIAPVTEGRKGISLRLCLPRGKRAGQTGEGRVIEARNL